MGNTEKTNANIKGSQLEAISLLYEEVFKEEKTKVLRKYVEITNSISENLNEVDSDSRDLFISTFKSCYIGSHRVCEQKEIKDLIDKEAAKKAREIFIERTTERGFKDVERRIERKHADKLYELQSENTKLENRVGYRESTIEKLEDELKEFRKKGIIKRIKDFMNKF